MGLPYLVSWWNFPQGTNALKLSPAHEEGGFFYPGNASIYLSVTVAGADLERIIGEQANVN